MTAKTCEPKHLPKGTDMTASTNGSATATVETLVAEVRTLMVGSRQVTLSVYKQLDRVSVWRIQPFGRVHTGIRYPDAYGVKEEATLELVGRDEDGNLVACVIAAYTDVPGCRRPAHYDSDEAKAKFAHWEARWKVLLPELQALPLIVLAGLR